MKTNIKQKQLFLNYFRAGAQRIHWAGLALTVCLLVSHDTCAAPLGTAVTYQGHLQQSGNPVNGLYDFRFSLWDDPGAGTLIGATQSVSSVTVSNSQFTVALDFEANAFNGDARWLDIAVGTNNGVTFTTLNPRQQFRPLPYALYAPGAGTSVTASSVAVGSISNAALAAGAITGDKIAGATIQSSNVNVTSFSDTFWRTAGNAGTTAGTHFLGTTDNQPLELKVNGVRALRLEDNGDGSDDDGTPDGAPNVIGGSPGNFVGAGVVGATISGGGAVNWGYNFNYTNRVEFDFGTVSGGAANTIQTSAFAATIGGGVGNTIQTGAHHTIIGGGIGNMIQTSADYATIGGGALNAIRSNADYATIGGGDNNTIQTNADFATIPGGRDNTATNYAFAAGRRAKANHTGSFVWADSTDADLASTANNQFLIRASGGVGIGTTSPTALLSVRGNTSLDASIGTHDYINDYVRIISSGSERARGGLRFDQGDASNLTHFAIWTEGTGGPVGYPGKLQIGLGKPAGGPGGPPVSAENNVVVSISDSGITTDKGVTAKTVTITSDREAKKDFAPVHPKEVLERLARLPIQTWAFKTEPNTRHIGPVAQDFYRDFGVGADDKHIATVDADGVALAAIKGLDQVVKEQEARIQALENGVAELKALVNTFGKRPNSNGL